MLHTPMGLRLDGDIATLSRDGRELMTVLVASAEDAAIEKKEGFDEGSIWISLEEEVVGDPLNTIPRAEYLSVTPWGKVAEAAFLSVLDVHQEGKRSTDSAETFTGENVRGVRIVKNGCASVALFRTGPGAMDHGGVLTDAGFTFVQLLEGGRRVFLVEAESLTLQGARYLASYRPVTIGLGYDRASFHGRIRALTTTRLELRVPSRPTQVLVEGEPAEFSYDPHRETVKFAVRRGVFEVRAAEAT